MVNGKFHIIGDTGSWIKMRVYEEINTQGIAGNVIDASENTIVVVVEGELQKVQDMYNTLNESSPDSYQFTGIEFTKEKETQLNQTDLAKSINQMISILGEIERNTRKLNQKMDVLSARGEITFQENPEKDKETKPSWNTNSSWNTPKETKNTDEEEEIATGGFASIFGD